MAVRTMNTGSLPKPASLSRARAAFADGDLDPDALRIEEERATREALALQEEVGIDLPTDGGMYREAGTAFFASGLEGVEASGWLRCRANLYVPALVVLGDIRRPQPVVVPRWRSAQSAIGRPVRAELPGPYSLMARSTDERYGSREACCLAFARALRDEIRDLIEAGAKELEIDEPALPGRPDELGMAAGALAEAVSVASGRSRVWIRLGHGDLVPLAASLADFPGEGWIVPCAAPDVDLSRLIGPLADGRAIAAGIVDGSTSALESASDLASRIERARRAVGTGELWVCTDSDLEGLSDAAARAKLVAVVAAARLATA